MFVIGQIRQKLLDISLSQRSGVLTARPSNQLARLIDVGLFGPKAIVAISDLRTQCAKQPVRTRSGVGSLRGRGDRCAVHAYSFL